MSEAQRSALSFVLIAGWTTALGLAGWRGCSTATATHMLEALRRRGLVSYSYSTDHWVATPRARKVLAGEDRRMGTAPR